MKEEMKTKLSNITCALRKLEYVSNNAFYKDFCKYFFVELNYKNYEVFPNIRNICLSSDGILHGLLENDYTCE